MEHVNSSATIRQQQQHQQLQQHHQEQQQQHEHQQQFCLRWHNHQTSLLSTLPVLLDQSHLTDVTISAEGRTLRAHRVVLSACSTFFLELFRALDISNHPIIIIPGASFAAIVALLTFMYSGEVNVYEEQIPMLLNLAETLGIKGLADVQNNKSTKQRQHTTDLFDINQHKDEPTEMATTPSPPPPLTPTIACSNAAAAAAAAAAIVQQQQQAQNTQFPILPTAAAASTLNSLTSPLLSNKFPTPLESFFLKSLQFYPNLLPQPLNFSQTALNKTTELLAKYQQQCSLYQSALGGLVAAKELLPQLNNSEELSGQSSNNEEIYSAAKRLCTGEKKPQQHHQQQPQQHSAQQQQQQQTKDNKRIDRIVENLRCGNKTPNSNEINTNVMQQQQHQQQQQQILHNSLNIKTSNAACNYTPTMLSPHLATKPPIFVNATSSSPSSASLTVAQQNQQQQQQHHQQQHSPYISAEDQVAKLQQHIDQYAATCSREVALSTATSTASGGGDVGGNACLKTETNLMGILPEKQQSTPTTPTAQTPSSPQSKTPSNSKLYATCFICHKQLSNQYNLRVHLETHQNVRYACNVCSHVSRSKDALRKHVSYRHPGAPSPCESDARRKRGAAKILNTAAPITVAATMGGACSTPTSPSTAAGVTMAGPFHLSAALNTTGSANCNSNIDNDMQQMAAAAQLSSAAYMFLPNQFHLTQQQQQQRQHIQNMVDAHNAVISATTAAAAAVAASSTPPAISVTNALDMATSVGGNASSNAATSNAITLTIAAAATTHNSNNNNNTSNNNNDNNVSIKSEHHSPALASTLSSPVPSQSQQDKGVTATAVYTVGNGGGTPRSSPSATAAAP